MSAVGSSVLSTCVFSLLAFAFAAKLSFNVFLPFWQTHEALRSPEEESGFAIGDLIVIDLVLLVLSVSAGVSLDHWALRRALLLASSVFLTSWLVFAVEVFVLGRNLRRIRRARDPNRDRCTE
jgi:hypothetical protein